jgi:uncharacterized protein YciI
MSNAKYPGNLMKICTSLCRPTVLMFALLSLCMNSLTAQQSANKTQFDGALAKRLGADDYGMKRYVMAFLKIGPNRDQDSVKAAELLRAHLKNIQRMAKEGTLVLAGPFLDGGDVQGIYVFNVKTVEEAQKLTETDPAVKAGRLVMELHPWYGSAAMVELNRIHATVEKKNVAE